MRDAAPCDDRVHARCDVVAAGRVWRTDKISARVGDDVEPAAIGTAACLADSRVPPRAPSRGCRPRRSGIATGARIQRHAARSALGEMRPAGLLGAHR